MVHKDYSPVEFVVEQAQGRGACLGDSGGPAFFEKDGSRFLVGVTNGAYDGRDCEGRGVYAQVVSHLAWIAEAAAALRQNP